MKWKCAASDSEMRVHCVWFSLVYYHSTICTGIYNHLDKEIVNFTCASHTYLLQHTITHLN
jgi:hypothetical protein